LSTTKRKHRYLILVTTIVAIVLATVLILFVIPRENTSSYPDTIDIDSKYYLEKTDSLDYTVIDYNDGLFIVQDTTLDTDYSMGVYSTDGMLLVSPMYQDMSFVSDSVIKGWKSETDVYYFDYTGKVLDHGDYGTLKDTYETPTTSVESYSVEEFQSTVYSNDEDGNPKKVLGKYVTYGTEGEIVFPKNVKFKSVTIANVKGTVFVGDVYDEIYYYSHDDQIALVKKDDEVYYCDLDGNPIFYVDCKFVEDDDGNPCFARKGFSELFPIYSFNHGYAITVQGESYGLINLEGKVIIDFDYDYIQQMPYNLYLAKQGDSVAICDISLNTGLVSPYFKNTQPFDDFVVLYDDSTNQSIIYSIEMNI
jgi:hypothetical protein